MPLSWLQRYFYRDLFTVWRIRRVRKDSTSAIKTPEYSQVGDSAILGRWKPTKDRTSPDFPQGGALDDILDTLDVLEFEAGSDVETSDFLRLDTVGHPLNGQWFKVVTLGETRNRFGGIFDPNYLQVRCSRIDVPPFDPNPPV